MIDSDLFFPDEFLAEEISVATDRDSFEYRVEEWKRGEIRVLFLTGLGGAGKTTYTRELSEATGARVLSLDGYVKGLLRAKYGVGAVREDFPGLMRAHGVETLLEANPVGRLIIEGGQLCWLDPDKLAEHAVFVIRTSLVKSTWRSILRDFTKEHWQQYHSVTPLFHAKINLKTLKALRGMIRALKASKGAEP